MLEMQHFQKRNLNSGNAAFPNKKDKKKSGNAAFQKRKRNSGNAAIPKKKYECWKCSISKKEK